MRGVGKHYSNDMEGKLIQDAGNTNKETKWPKSDEIR